MLGQSALAAGGTPSEGCCAHAGEGQKVLLAQHPTVEAPRGWQAVVAHSEGLVCRCLRRPEQEEATSHPLQAQTVRAGATPRPGSGRCGLCSSGRLPGPAAS